VQNSAGVEIIRRDIVALAEVGADLRVLVFDPTIRDQLARFGVLQRAVQRRPGLRFLAIGLPRSEPAEIPFRAWTT